MKHRFVLFLLAITLSAGVWLPLYASETTSTTTVSKHSPKKKVNKHTGGRSKTRVLGNTYVADYSMDGISVRQGIRFDPNGRMAVTTQMMGQQQTRSGEWSQDGNKIITNVGTLLLDENGNLHQGNIIFYRK